MKKSVAIIGGGPSALFLAAFLDSSRFEVTIYEKNKSLGRKFLVAGKGGFNLTHSEEMEAFVERYTPSLFLRQALLDFDNKQLQEWLEEIGIPTFVGSSKRVYPVKGIKPIEVLNKIIAVLKGKAVRFEMEQNWTGWNDQGELTFESGLAVKMDYHVFALGGGSWKVTGSDGAWLDVFAAKGISTQAFQAANCAYQIHWPEEFIKKQEGRPLKNIALICGDRIQKGEVVITKFGLEGNAIYALSPQIQRQLNEEKSAALFLDLKPVFTEQDILNRLHTTKGKNISDKLRKVLRLSNSQVGLLKSHLTKDEYLDIHQLVPKIKSLALKVTSSAPIDEAISTTGGIALSALDSNFELKKMKGSFCIGEMVDWNAPTGGYLLQACFSMGVLVARDLMGR